MSRELVKALKQAVGPRYVLASARHTARYRRGFRSGGGEATAVVRPGTLIEYWRALQACVAHDAIIIMQAANTGLTEGSAPNGQYDRPVVVINTLRLDTIRLINGGQQILSFAGGTLYRLEQLLRPLHREPHSVIGSSCLGASIVGGICNNSGGALVQRGPAYTELALFAQLGQDGQLRLVNHLGIRLGDTPEEILGRLERGEYGPDDIEAGNGIASDRDYARRVRDVDAASAARFNADPRRLHEASGSAGKVAVFAVRLDTFPSAEREQVFYVCTNDPAALTALRRRLLAMRTLPIAGEYLHRDMFDIARRYGKDTFLVIHYLGTDVMPGFFDLKGRIDGWFNSLPLPRQMSDRVLQACSQLWPEMLPRRMLDYRNRYEHHLLLRVAGEGIEETAAVLDEHFSDGQGGYFTCTPDEGKRAFLHRFAAAGAAARYALVRGRQLLPLDIALRRNDADWREVLPVDVAHDVELKLYYGHFLCHVFHQDYVLKPGADLDEVKQRMLVELDRRGAQYPAEHNVGHMYHGAPGHLAHFHALDPTNSFNPGIGKDSRARDYA